MPGRPCRPGTPRAAAAGAAAAELATAGCGGDGGGGGARGGGPGSGRWAGGVGTGTGCCEGAGQWAGRPGRPGSYTGQGCGAGWSTWSDSAAGSTAAAAAAPPPGWWWRSWLQRPRPAGGGTCGRGGARVGAQGGARSAEWPLPARAGQDSLNGLGGVAGEVWARPMSRQQPVPHPPHCGPSSPPRSYQRTQPASSQSCCAG